MAIKAIINNTEKEIEQIKNSDGQDIDYVYSRIGEKEAEGESTVSIKSIGGELTNYRIYGNTINGESVGDRTANLWDEIYEEDGTLHYVPIAVGDGVFTLSTTIPNGPPANIFFLAGNVGSGASTVRNGVWGENSRTIEAVDGYVTIAYEAGQSFGEQCYPWNNDTMLNAGSTALPYEPYGYRVPVTIEGKNLLQNTVKSQTKNGVTFTVNNDGSITCNGTASNNTFLKIGDLSLTSQNYILTGCPSDGGNDSYALRCYKNGNIKGTDVGNGFNINESIDGYIEIRIASGYTCDNLTFYPMICKADIKDDTYEPYHEPIITNLYLPEPLKMVGDEAEHIDYREQKMHKVRKNLLPVVATSKTVTGVTFTVNVDKSVTCNGRNRGTSDIIFEFNQSGISLEKGRMYIVNGCPEGGAERGSYAIQCYNGSFWVYDIGHGEEFPAWGTGIVRPQIIIPVGVTVNNLTFYPMIRTANIEDDTYEPYIENTDLDVTLPALSTIKGTNTLSVNTSIQSSNIYIKDGFDYKRVFTATRAIEGIPPLTYKAVEGALNNYRIYGNTVDGESVGDRTANLFNGELQNGYWSTLETLAQTSSAVFRSFKIFLPAGTYTITFATNVNIVRLIADGAITQNIGNNLTEYTFTTQTNDDVGFSFRITGTSQVPWDNSNIMLNIGSVAIPYEPYGYRVPVTVTNETDTETTNIYLDEQLTKSGDNADYIDYATQKRHNSDGMESSITLPEIAVTAGSNILSVETGVQPSNIYLKGKIKKKPKIYYKIYYYSQDGQTLLYTESVLKGSNGMYSGTPTKMADSQYTYTFAGWSSSTGQTTATPKVRNNIQNDKNVYAAFSQTLNTYTVYFYNESDTPIETVQNVPYGGTATYTGSTPTKAETSEYTYTFAGWNTNSSASTADADALTNVTADRTVYAIFTAVPKGYTVYFYNGETLLETVTGVPSGGTATYTGATPTKQGYSFTGWSPLPTNITADTSCYAQFKAPYITDSWEVISQRSAAGTAQNYYSVGDCKPIELNGTMGTLALNTTLYVYILGFNHNSTYEPNGITFGCFKTAATRGIDVCLVDSKYGSSDTSGTKYFNMSHRGNYNYGGWKGSDMRYDILGSTDVQPSGYGSAPTTSKTGYDATSTCATNPVANTLMSCLPSDLRSVMKPMTKYTDDKGNRPNVEANVTTSIDYLPLLSEYEVQGTGKYASSYEKNKQAQYTYYSGGNSKIKYGHSATSTAVAWWVRSPHYNSGNRFCRVVMAGGASVDNAGYSRGVAPCFLV